MTTGVVERRNARRYLTGLGASTLGDSAMTLVAGIWVKQLTGSSAAAALVSVCVYAPTLLAPLAGLLADRVRRRRLLVVVNLAMAAVVASLLAVRDADQVGLLFAVMTLYGVAIVVSDPAENALFASAFGEDTRRRLNGLRLTLTESGKLGAPLLGAGLYAWLGGGWVAALDAATFVLAALAIASLRVEDPVPAHDTDDGWGQQVAAGLAHVRRTPDLRAVLVAAALVMAASGIAVAAQYGLVDALGRPPAFLGVLTALLGAGSVVAGLVSGKLVARFGERALALAGLADYAVGTSLRATGWLPLALAGSLLLGFALPWSVLAVLNLFQRRTPDALQGRVAALVTLALFGPQPLTQLLGAALIGPLGYRTLYVVTAVVALGAGAYLVRARRE